MPDQPKTYRYFSLLFFVSGFAGIIYQSVWAQYARILFGHAAFAQTFVLVLFLGGLALGAWFGQYVTARYRRLFLAYAIIEALIGLLALTFHPLFGGVKNLVFNILYQSVPGMAGSLKYLLLCLVTLPPTLLLGATFPVISSALQRRMPARKGSVISQMYFVNSLGAAIGILAASFLLIPDFGLPGSMLIAGGLNLLVFAMAMIFKDKSPEMPVESLASESDAGTGKSGIYIFMLAAAVFTGASSFMYEIAWIRMLSMVLGSSVHAFELMLSAFILGLAIGSWWIRQRIDKLKSPERTLFFAQLLMGLFAIASLLIYNGTFRFMEWLLHHIERNEQGYFLFNLSGHLISMLVMLPATICAGMSLPLMIAILQNKGFGEPVIGKIYALDTGGGIVGVLVAVHLLMPLLGLKYLMMIAGLLDILIALFLLINGYVKKSRWILTAAFTGLIMAGSAFLFIHPDAIGMASGVFRYGMVDRKNRILFHRDGKTATIAVYETPNGNIVLSTNGKPDASVNLYRQVSGDEATQVLLAALPMAIRYEQDNVAVIGLGSGKTAHTALMNFIVDTLDVIEIEPAVFEATAYFRPHVENIFIDRRFHLHLADARTHLVSSAKKYDLIISEPSNPWVAGNASLFSREFYSMIGQKLNSQGMFVQWLHTYEMNLPLMASVVKAFSPEFEDYRMYYLDDGDLAIIGRKTGKLADPSQVIFNNREMKVELSRLGIEIIDDLSLRYLGNKQVLDPLFFSYDVPANSDYYPYLEYQAPRARFLQESTGTLTGLLTFPAPVLKSMGVGREVEPEKLGGNYPFNLAQNYRTAWWIYKIFESDGDSAVYFEKLDNYHRLLVEKMRTKSEPADSLQPDHPAMPWLKAFADATIPYLDQAQMEMIWNFFDEDILPERAGKTIDLYRAAGRMDYRRILELTGDLQEKLLIMPVPWEEYRLALTLWALLQTNQPDEALLLYQKYEHEVEPPLILRFLVSHAQASSGLKAGATFEQ